MKKTAIFWLLVIVLGGALALKIFPKRTVPAKEAAFLRPPQKTAVRVAEVERGDVALIFSYVGSLKAKEEANVYSKVAGKLVGYAVKEGEHVEKGQAIASIDRDETGLKYELAQAESPIAGIVGKTFLDKGVAILGTSGVAAGTPLAIIVNMDEMKVRLDVAEPDIPYLKAGLSAEVKVDAYPEEEFCGEITKISEVVDSLTRTLPLEITVVNPGYKLKSGMFCRVKIIAGVHQGVLMILQDALVQELGSNYVFVAEGGIARKKPVTLGIQEDGRWEVLDGLNERDQAIIFGQQGLKDSSAVEIASE